MNIYVNIRQNIMDFWISNKKDFLQSTDVNNGGYVVYEYVPHGNYYEIARIDINGNHTYFYEDKKYSEKEFLKLIRLIGVFS